MTFPPEHDQLSLSVDETVRTRIEMLSECARTLWRKLAFEANFSSSMGILFVGSYEACFSRQLNRTVSVKTTQEHRAKLTCQ